MTFLKLLVTVPLTQVIYFGALLPALLLRRVEWRGVQYKIDGSWKIRLASYRPHTAVEAAPDDAVASL